MVFALLALTLVAQSQEPPVPGRYSFVSQRKVEPSDLEGLPAEQLRIMRNEVFARKGHRFKSPDLRAYFEKQPWYRPQSSDVTAKLTKLEVANVKLIRTREDKLARERSPEELGGDLIGAAIKGDVTKVKALLRAGAPVDWEEGLGDSAIHAAAASGHAKVIRALLAAGADVDDIGAHELTPLGHATSNNRIEAAKVLLKAGANPNRKLACDTETALLYARTRAMKRLLRKHGATDGGTVCLAD